LALMIGTMRLHIQVLDVLGRAAGRADCGTGS
jgi:hypothetical protein